MKTTFDIRRFFKLFVNDFVLNYKKYGLILVVLAALTTLMFIFATLINEKIETSMILGLAIIGIMNVQGVYTSMIWKDFSSKTGTIALLTTPVHKSEIFFQRFISCFVILPALYILYIWLILGLAIEYNYIQHLSNGFEPDSYKATVCGTLKDFFSQKEALYVLICSWFFVASAFFWGALRFRKYIFLKTVAYWFVAIFSLWPISIFLRLLITGKYSAEIVPLFAYKNENLDFFLMEYCTHYYMYLTGFVCLSLITISYFKLKEKTV